MNPPEPATRRVTIETLETPTLTKAELAELLFERLGLNKRESKDMVDAFFDMIHGTLVAGQDVKLSGFGNFNIRRKAPRPGRNPRNRARHRAVRRPKLSERRKRRHRFRRARRSRPSRSNRSSIASRAARRNRS